ncbi:MAG: glycosyltransferase family 2 protein [Proteobacteria bacterium]|nr:MAG: glycosyltransferase family 2 protein [Pseudomonadota bacterium]
MATSKPLVSGFTVIRNGVLMGYPVLQSIKSVLPLVDEFVVGVGQSDDNTKEMILGIGDPKIKIFDSFWDTKKTKGGLILSEKTNEALDRCTHDWCFYIQADEVVHEEDYPAIRQALAENADNKSVQGLLFKYIHFYGSYGSIATNRKWYRNEVRIVRKSTGIRSHNDAQGFRVNGEKPWVKQSGGRIFHYGWVKPPKLMGQKSKLLNRWWHGDKMDKDFEDFKYDRQYGLKNFQQTHPEIMKDLVASQDWSFDPRRTLAEWKWKDLRLLTSDWIEMATGHRLGEYKPYRLL